jgi:hypothetical protein
MLKKDSYELQLLNAFQPFAFLSALKTERPGFQGAFGLGVEKQLGKNSKLQISYDPATREAQVRFLKI